MPCAKSPTAAASFWPEHRAETRFPQMARQIELTPYATRNRSKNVHIFPTNIVYGARIARVTEYIHSRNIFGGVEIVGIREADLPRKETTKDGRIIWRFDVAPRLRNRSRIERLIGFLPWYVSVLHHYRGEDIGCVNAHSASVLPLSWLLAKFHHCPLIYEPHELESETASARGLMRTAIRIVERTFAKNAAAVVAVHRGIAEWYQEQYRIARVWAVRNLPASTNYVPLSAHYYADRFGFARRDLVFLYQGVLSEGRGIRLLIDAFRSLPGARQLVFLGFGPLEEMVASASRELPNVHFHPAVPPEELLRYTAAAHVGVMMIAPVSLSYHYCYPNKYCENLSVGRPVVYTDSLWLDKEAKEYDCGWPAPYDVAGLTGVLSAIDQNAIEAKSRGARR